MGGAGSAAGAATATGEAAGGSLACLIVQPITERTVSVTTTNFPLTPVGTSNARSFPMGDVQRLDMPRPYAEYFVMATMSTRS